MKQKLKKAKKMAIPQHVSSLQHASSLQHVSPPPVKISEAILNISESLRARFKAETRVQTIISLTIMAWNISLFPPKEQEGMRKKILEKLKLQIDRLDNDVLSETLDMLINRKNTLYPDIKESILEYDVKITSDNLTLSVKTAPVSEKNLRKDFIKDGN